MDPFSIIVWKMAPLVFVGYFLSISIAVVTLDTDITLKQIAAAAVIGNILSLMVGLLSSGVVQALYELIRDPLLAALIANYGANFVLQILNLRYVGKVNWKAGIKIYLLSTSILFSIFSLFMPQIISSSLR